MEREYLLGLDIGGTKTACVVGDLNGNLCDRVEFPTLSTASGEDVFERICIRAEELLKSYPVRGISVSVGGPLDLDRGVLLNPPHLPTWSGFPLRRRLEDRFDLPVFIEHDGNAGVLAEWYFGHGKGLTNIVFITHGTGFGAGVILNGMLYRGSNSLAGEIGHIRIAEDGPQAFGKRGSVESFCGGLGIRLTAAWMFPEMYGNVSAAKEVIEDYHRGQPEAIKVIEKVAFYTGRALAVIMDLLNPELIVLGVLSHRLGERFIRLVKEFARVEAIEATYKACEIKPTAFGQRIGDIAALMAAVHFYRNNKEKGA